MGTELQKLNGQSKAVEWASRITECRNSGLGVKVWCKENGVCEQTYYKWQRRLFNLAKAQQEKQFVEVTPISSMGPCPRVAVTIRTNSVAVDVHDGADVAMVETLLRIMKLC